jgi:hypothetical protein
LLIRLSRRAFGVLNPACKQWPFDILNPVLLLVARLWLSLGREKTANPFVKGGICRYFPRLHRDLKQMGLDRSEIDAGQLLM